MDMLATTHVNRRGIYLWSNSAIYGNGADIRPSNTPVDARLPTLSAGVRYLPLLAFLPMHGHPALSTDLNLASACVICLVICSVGKCPASRLRF